MTWTSGNLLRTHVINIPKFGGNIYYVSNNTGNDYNEGKSPDEALKTIGKAIDKLSEGDAINIMAGMYTETGLDLSVNNCEMWFEIGAILNPGSGVPLTVSANYCWIGCHNGALRINNNKGTNTGVLCTGNWIYLSEIRVSCSSTGSVGFDIQGDGCDLRRCRCSDPTTAAFRVTGNKAKLDLCCTGGNSTDSSIGYHISGSSNKFRLRDCASQGHPGGGFVIETPCTDGEIIGFDTGGGDGKWTRGKDTGTVISGLEYEETKFATTTFTNTGGVGSAGTHYNIFKVIGAVKVYNIYGHVETEIPNTSSNIYLRVSSSNGVSDITNNVGAPDIDSAVTGSVLERVGPATDALQLAEISGGPGLLENTDKDPNTPVVLIEDPSADTYIQAVLDAALASGEIQWHVVWEEVSEDGFLEPA